jgi:hypothetical protein
MCQGVGATLFFMLEYLAVPGKVSETGYLNEITALIFCRAMVDKSSFVSKIKTNLIKSV